MTPNKTILDTPVFTQKEATDFFAELYHGEHHIPGKIFPWGDGFCVKDRGGRLATFDYNDLTRLVLMAHDKCYRVEISPITMGYLRIAIWKRQREGAFSCRHPTIEQAIESYNQIKSHRNDGK